MDKRIFGSILTILILLGVLWVFAGRPKWDITGSYVTSNGSRNFTATRDVVGRVFAGNITLTFTILPEFNISNTMKLNLTNVTIYQLGSKYFNLTKIVNISGVGSNVMACNVLGEFGSKGVECTNMTAPTNVSGTTTLLIKVAAELNKSYGSLNIENRTASQWDVYVFTNQSPDSIVGKIGRVNGSEFGVIRTLSFGIDDLKPRISSINISDGTYTRTGKGKYFNESTKGAVLLNNTDIIVNITVNDYNKQDVYMFWGIWNGTLKAPVATGGWVGTNWSVAFSQGTPGGTPAGTRLGHNYINMTRGSDCIYPLYGGVSASCRYGARIKNSANSFNFSDGVTYTLMFWTNDTFNHEANFTNSDSGYNFTIDGDTPLTAITMPTITSISSGRSITIKCEAWDSDGVIASSGLVTIISPSGKRVTKAVDNENSEAVFSGVAETGEAGLYKVICEATDSVSHTYASEVSEEKQFRVMARSVAAAGEAPEAPVAKVDISSTETPSGSISGVQGESDTFTVNGATAHRLTFLEIGKDYAKIKIESMPVELTLKVGESKEIELDDQTVKVTLSSIVNGKASVSVTNVAKYEEKIEEEKAAREAPVTEEKGYGLWVTLLVIVVLIVIGYLVLKSRKGKKGEIHFTRQDLGL